MTVHASLKSSLILAGLLACGVGYAQYGSTGTPATTTTTTTQAPKAATGGADKAAHDKIEEQAKADKKACEALKDNAKDVCQAEAKAKEKIAKAELQYQKDPSERNRVKLAEMKAEGNYEVAKEKCDDKSGNDREACRKEAKAAETAAKADAKASMKKTDSKS
jgi:hypothetical protein